MNDQFISGQMMDYPLTVDRLLEHANRLYASKRISTKLPDGSFHHYTYADLYKRVKRLGNVLVRLGVKIGDRIGTFGWNSYQHYEMYFGIPCSGAVCHTLNIRLSGEQLIYIINHAEDKLIFVDASLLPLMEAIADKLKTVKHFILFNAPIGTPSKLPNLLHYEDLMNEVNEEFVWRSTDEKMALGLCYTSGTTGNPKGVLYSHRSMFLHTYALNLSICFGLTSRDVVLPVVPQFHAQAWGIPYACAMVGAEVVMPSMHLAPAALAETIERLHVTVAAGVPTIWNGLYHELKTKPRDLSSLRLLVVGGAAMPKSLIEAYEKDLKVSVLHAWGMTEMSPLGTVSRLQNHHDKLSADEAFNIKAAQGYPIAGVEMRIVNEEGNELPWDGHAVGELQVRGAWVVRRYFRQEESSVPDFFTDDEWFRTGDVASISSDGYLKITDRTKDLIKSGGEWISSVELENALVAHPKVKEAAVIAIPNERWNERPLALVVPMAFDRVPDKAELLTHLTNKFAKIWLPDDFIMVKEIPKTSVGKIDKKVLRQRYKEGTLV